MRLRIVASAVALLSLCLAAPGALRAVEIATPAPLTLDHYGYEMTMGEAAQRIAFRPFIPTPSYSNVALLPAFHGDDKDHVENRGIGFEYTQSGHTYILREWPAAGGSIDKYPPLKGEGTCTDVHIILGAPSNPHGYAWQTKALVFALQPEPATDTRMLRAEFVRLVRHGACR